MAASMISACSTSSRCATSTSAPWRTRASISSTRPMCWPMRRQRASSAVSCARATLEAVAWPPGPGTRLWQAERRGIDRRASEALGDARELTELEGHERCTRGPILDDRSRDSDDQHGHGEAQELMLPCGPRGSQRVWLDGHRQNPVPGVKFYPPAPGPCDDLSERVESTHACVLRPVSGLLSRRVPRPPAIRGRRRSARGTSGPSRRSMR